MKDSYWVDSKGYKHHSLIRDDFDMPEEGILRDPPDIQSLPWEDIKRDIHNHLVNMGLYTYQDLMRVQNGVTGAINGALKRRIVALYKERRQELR